MWIVIIIYIIWIYLIIFVFKIVYSLFISKFKNGKKKKKLHKNEFNIYKIFFTKIL